jgi:hypothetical protein
MTSVVLSAQSKKAWVAGAVSALLQPILNLLIGSEVISWRVVLVAVISGILGFVAVWVAENDKAPAPAPVIVPKVTMPQVTQVDPLQEAATEDFGGQTTTL